MNKSELVDRVANASSLAKRDVENVLDALFDTVKNAVKTGDQVSWPGLGSFKGSQRSATHRAQSAHRCTRQNPGVQKHEVHGEVCSEGPSQHEGSLQAGLGQEGDGQESTGQEGCKEQQEALRKGGI